MKNNIFKLALTATMCIGMATFCACEKADEMPPRIDKNATANRVYKLPDPTSQTNEERDMVDSVKNEYENAIK